MNGNSRKTREGFELTVSTGAYIPYPGVPVARGVSLPEGELRDLASVRAVDAFARPHPVQATPLGRWPDGSVKWALIELPADVPASPLPRARRAREGFPAGTSHAAARYRVRFLRGAPQSRGDVRCTETRDAIEIRNSRLQVRFSRRRCSIFEAVRLDGADLIRPGGRSDILVEDDKGRTYHASLAQDFRCEVEHAGPVRSTVRISGKHTAPDGSTFLDFRLRISVFHGCPDVLVEHQFTNREDAMPGVKVKSLRLVQDLCVGKTPVRALRQGMHGADTEPRPIGGIRQDLAIQVGTAACQALGFNGPMVADNRIFHEDLSAMDFHIRDYPSVLHATGPWLDLSGRVGRRIQGATVFFRNMAENHPKIIETTGAGMVLHVVPEMPQPLHYLQGWSKRHDIVFCFHAGPRPVDPESQDQAWYRWENRPNVMVPFAWYQSTAAEDMDKIMPPRFRKYPVLETKLLWVPQIGGSTGMIHWGDVFTGEGRWGAGGAGWNHEEDTPYGQFLLALRNEDGARFANTCVCCRHMVDIDSISYSPDPLRNGAIAPHSRDHVRGATYPSHMWITGICLYYYLSGDPDAREAAIAQAEVNLRFIATRWNATTLTGREHGWPILNLGFVYELTGNRRYLDGARRLIADVERRLHEYGGVLYKHHRYGFSEFANYSIYEGMYKCWKTSGDARLRKAFLAVVDWLITTAFGPRGFSYCRNGQYFANLYPLAMAHYMTGDERYAAAGRVGTILMMAYHTIDTWCLRELLHFLPLADARGWIQDCAPQNAE